MRVLLNIDDDNGKLVDFSVRNPDRETMLFLVRTLRAHVPPKASAWQVRIVGVGAYKINMIKTVREITRLGLKEAKEVVESAPSGIVYAGTDAGLANNIVRALIRAGGHAVKEPA